MVNPVSWFAFKALICVGTVPDLPILNSEVLLMSTPLLSFGGKKESALVFWTVVGDFARLLPAAFASWLFASLFAALRVPALLYAVFVGFVCGIALFWPCPHLTRFQSFGLVSVQMVMIIGMLVATSAVAGKVLSERFWLEISCPMAEMIGCHCGAAAMLVEAAALSYLFMKMRMQAAAACAAALEGVQAAAKAAVNSEGYVQDSLFVIAGGLVSDLLLTSAAFAFVGINVKMLLHAAAALAPAPGDLHVPEILSAIVGPCHVFAFFLRILDWPSRALGAVVSWICDIGVALEWSVPGACKKQSSTFSKEKRL